MIGYIKPQVRISDDREQTKIKLVSDVIMFIAWRTENQFINALQMVDMLRISEDEKFIATEALNNAIGSSIYRSAIKNLVTKYNFESKRDYCNMWIGDDCIHCTHVVKWGVLKKEEYWQLLKKSCGKII